MLSLDPRLQRANFIEKAGFVERATPGQYAELCRNGVEFGLPSGDNADYNVCEACLDVCFELSPSIFSHRGRPIWPFC